MSLEYLSTDDHDDFDDLLATAEFAAESFVSTDFGLVRVSQAGAVFDRRSEETLYSPIEGR